MVEQERAGLGEGQLEQLAAEQARLQDTTPKEGLERRPERRETFITASGVPKTTGLASEAGRGSPGGKS